MNDVVVVVVVVVVVHVTVVCSCVFVDYRRRVWFLGSYSILAHIKCVSCVASESLP